MKARVDLSDSNQYVENPYGEVEIKLSRRNLLSLLHKLDWDDSACTIQKSQGQISLTIVGESDDEHYGESEAGVMHDETERFIEEYAQKQREETERNESRKDLSDLTTIFASWHPDPALWENRK
jgi:hypothetical protein